METFESILSRMESKFSELSGVELDAASDVGIRLKVLAGEIFALENNIDWLKNQMFIQTATGQQLDYHAVERGIERAQATKSKGFLKFSRTTADDEQNIVPAGTICATSGINSIRFKTINDVTFDSKSLSVVVEAESEEEGTKYNTGVGTITVMINPPPGVTSVTNSSAFTGGTNAETDDSLRERLIQSYNNISNGTNCAFYIEEALKYDKVYSATAIAKKRGNGTVNVYVAGKGALLSDDEIEIIQNGMSSLKEINVDVLVCSPTFTSVSLGVYITVKNGYKFASVKQSCISELNTYFNSLKIGEPFLLSNVGEVLYHIEGVKSYTFMNSISNNRIASADQLFKNGGITIEEGS